MNHIMSVLLTLWSIASYAQCNIVLKGSISDDHNNSPIAFVPIQVEGGNPVFSDQNGNFTISNLCVGTIRLKATHLGYETLKYKIFLKKDSTIAVSLHSTVCSIDEIEVHVHSDELEPSCIHTSTEEEITSSISESISQQLEKTNGVNIIQTGATISKPSINGMHSNRISMINNGVKLESQNWGMEHAPELSNSLFDELKVIKGAQGVKYGSEAIGGVVLVEPKPFDDSTRFSGFVGSSFNTNNRGVTSIFGIQNGFKNINYRFTAGFKKFGYYTTPTYIPKNTGLNELNLTSLVEHKRGKWTNLIYVSNFNSTIGIFSGAHIGNLTDLQNAISAEEPRPEYLSDFSYKFDGPYQNVWHNTLKLESRFAKNDQTLWNLAYSRQFNNRQEFDAHNSAGDSPDLNLFLTSHNLNISRNTKTDTLGISELGLQTKYQKNTYSGRFFIPNYENINAGLYGFRRFFKPKTTYEVGGRIDAQNLIVYRFINGILDTKQRFYFNPSFNLGMNTSLSEKLIVVANGGYSWRAPAISELYANGVHHGAATFEIGDFNLKSEKSLQGIATLHYSNLSKTKFEVGGFANYFFNYINLAPTGETILTIRGAFPKFEYQESAAIFRGLDIGFEQILKKHFSFKNKSSLILANATNGSYLNFIPPFSFSNSIKYHNNNIGKLEHFYTEAEVYSVLKQNRIDLENEFLDSPNGYNLVNLTAGVEADKFNFSVKAKNILNTTYRSYMNRFRYFINEPSTSLILNLIYNF